MSVFANFGYELPASGSSSVQCIPEERSEPDGSRRSCLLWQWNFSVALYIGDGKVVHALNSNKGIVITDYNYDTPVGVGSYME